MQNRAGRRKREKYKTQKRRAPTSARTVQGKQTIALRLPLAKGPVLPWEAGAP